MKEILLEPEQKILDFTTINYNSLCVVYNYKKTTILSILNLLNDNYSLGKTDNFLKLIEVHSEDLGRSIEEQDYNKTGYDLKLNSKSRFKFVLKQTTYKEKKRKENTEDVKQEEIQIFIKHLNGKITTLKVDNEMNVRELKKIIAEKEGIPPDQQRIIFAGECLEDKETLKEVGIKNCYTLHLVLRLRGGMYEETSGKSGNYQDLDKNVVLFIE